MADSTRSQSPMPGPFPPQGLRKRVTELARDRARLLREKDRDEARLQDLRKSLEIADKVEAALEELSRKLFEEIIRVLEEKLSIALQEVLGQPIRLKAEAAYKRSSASVEFHVERGGQAEDILEGQGGSVANILSVGLRMFALTTLPEERHRRFLVLDEQDCWLRPDLVPRLVKIIRDAGRALGFQVILISHHDLAAFDRYADRIYRFSPKEDGEVRVELWQAGPAERDQGS